MTRTAVLVRRSTTVVGVLVILALAFLAIRLAAAWTANAAQLEVAPVSVDALQAQVDAERARTAELSSELRRLMSQSDDLTAALNAAKAQIGRDADHARTLSADLASAREKLRSLEASIQEARSALAEQPTMTVQTASTGQTLLAGGGGDHDDDDEDDHEEHDDD